MPKLTESLTSYVVFEVEEYMVTPLVSVIVPTYNRPFLLRYRSIPSLLAQTYSHWELIVVGDGPADDSSRRVIEGFQDVRMKYVEIQRPDYSKLDSQEMWHIAGVKARNYGLLLAQGDIIAPLDDDDEFCPNHLAQSVEYLIKHAADLVYGCVLVRNLETGIDYQDYFPWEELESQSRFEHRNIMYHSSVCYAGRFRHLMYPDDGVLCGDYGLWLAIRRAGGTFGSVASPQSIYYGDRLTSRIRLALPSLSSVRDALSAGCGVLSADVVTDPSASARLIESSLLDQAGLVGARVVMGRRSAILLALTAAGKAAPDRKKVIVPSYSPPEVGDALALSGLEVVFCEVEESTLCVAPSEVVSLLSDQILAVLAIHSHGMRCDIPALRAVTHPAGAAIIGITVGDLRPGWLQSNSVQHELADFEVTYFGSAEASVLGDVAAVYYPRGMDGDVAAGHDRLRAASAAIQTEVGGAGAPPAVVAAAVSSRLPSTESFELQRRRAVSQYLEAFGGHEGVRFQPSRSVVGPHAWYDLVLRFASPAHATAVASTLSAYKVEHSRLSPLHLRADLRSSDPRTLPRTEGAASCSLLVPLYSDIRPEVVELVSGAVLEGVMAFDVGTSGATTDESHSDSL